MKNISLRAILIDDEKSARENLRLLLRSFLPNVVIVAEAASISSALKVIDEHEADVLFLDIAMPSGSGFTLLEKLKDIPFEVIFVTAYEQYAIRAIRYAAIDYLLKPINSDELVAAVSRAAIRNQSKQKKENLETLANYIKTRGYERKKILLPKSDGLLVVDMEDIIRCEGEGSYTSIYFSNGGKIVEGKTLKHYQELLDPSLFFRIYQSHLVNLMHVKEYLGGRGGHVLLSDGSKLPVSRDRKSDFLRKLQHHFSTSSQTIR